VCHDTEMTLDFIRDYCSDYEKKWTGVSARGIPILPNKIDVEYLARDLKHCPEGTFPIGVEKSTLAMTYHSFNSSYINMVLSQTSDHSDFVQGLAEVLAAKGESEVMVFDPDSAFARDDNKNYRYEDNELDAVVAEIFNQVVMRHNTHKDAKERGEVLPSFNKITCIINSLSALMPQVSEDSRDKVRLIMEKGETAFNLSFVIVDVVSNIASLSYESWFKARVSLNEGIWMGNGFTDQYQMKVTKITNDMYKDIGDNFGYLITRGKPRLIKLLSSITRENEVEGNG